MRNVQKSAWRGAEFTKPVADERGEISMERNSRTAIVALEARTATNCGPEPLPLAIAGDGKL
jgi:hypothetical protein